MPLFQVWLDYLSSLGYKNFYKVLNSKDYGVPQNRDCVFMFSILDKEASFTFPNSQLLLTKLSDLLETKAGFMYYLSIKLIEYFSDMADRNACVRDLRYSTVHACFQSSVFEDWSIQKKTPPKIDGVVKLF